MQQVYITESKWREKRKRHITVYLRKESGDDLHMYYCPSCRHPILQYKGEVMQEIPGLAPSRMPMIVQCKNRVCQRLYHFISFVEEDF